MKAKVDSPASNQPAFFIGTSGWTYDDWKGSFYPASLPRKAWFDYYASQFSTVEVNATFYRTFKDETYQKWRQRAPEGFGYVLKAPKLITHRKLLVDADEEIKSFYDSCALLEEKFELILLQVAPNMPVELERLQKALLAFPDPSKVAVEFRRPEWLNSDTLNLLRSVGTTICNVDSPQHKITSCLTSECTYLRMHGRGRWYAYNYSEAELNEIAVHTQELVEKGAKKVYIFFNNDYDANAPKNAITLRGLLAEMFG